MPGRAGSSPARPVSSSLRFREEACPAEQLGDRRAHLRIARAGRRGAGDEDDVGAGSNGCQARGLAQEAPDAIAHDRIADAATDREAIARMVEAVGLVAKHEERMVLDAALALDADELGALCEAAILP